MRSGPRPVYGAGIAAYPLQLGFQSARDLLGINYWGGTMLLRVCFLRGRRRAQGGEAVVRQSGKPALWILSQVFVKVGSVVALRDALPEYGLVLQRRSREDSRRYVHRRRTEKIEVALQGRTRHPRLLTPTGPGRP